MGCRTGSRETIGYLNKFYRMLIVDPKDIYEEYYKRRLHKMRWHDTAPDSFNQIFYFYEPQQIGYSIFSSFW